MTSYSPRIYIYKITFEEVPYYYYGVHKEKIFGEEYWGSPKTNKWCWELYTPKKQILELFDFTDEGWVEAQEVETRLIRPFYNTDKWCLNESCGGKASLKVLRETGNKIKELGIGICGRTKEQMSEDSKRGGKITGKKNKENKTGVCGRTKEKMSEDGKKAGKIGGKIGGKKTYELSVGIFGLTQEEKNNRNIKGGKSASKITNSQKWMCLETRFITNPGNLTKYQRARSIDTSKRKRIE